MQGVKPSKLDRSWTGQASDASADVVSSFNGQAKIHDGVLSTQRITLEMPGVDVDLSGSFNLRDSTVDRTGNLRMLSDISHTTTGFKLALMKPLTPFFQRTEPVPFNPFAVTGGPANTTPTTHQKGSGRIIGLSSVTTRAMGPCSDTVFGLLC
jgi:hypothetical protein